MSFVWIVTFDLWNLKSPSFGLIKQFDCDSMGSIGIIIYFIKISNLLKYYQLNNVVNHFNPLQN